MINMNPWDVAAGTLLVREAGGRVTDFSAGNLILTARIFSPQIEGSIKNCSR